MTGPDPVPSHAVEREDRLQAGRSPDQLPAHILLLNFAYVGSVGFGGVLPWLRWLLVEKRGWYSDEDFLRLFAFANILPGGNAINMTVMTGARFGGFRGAVAALTGLVFPSAILVCVIGEAYARYRHLEVVEDTVGGLSAAASGLILAMGLKMLKPMRRSPLAIAMILAVIAMTVFIQLPLPVILTAAIPLSLLLRLRQGNR